MMRLEVAPSWILTYILAFLCWVIQCCRPQFPTALRACVCRTFVVGYSTKLMMDGMQCQKPRVSQGKGAVQRHIVSLLTSIMHALKMRREEEDTCRLGMLSILAVGIVVVWAY